MEAFILFFLLNFLLQACAQTTLRSSDIVIAVKTTKKNHATRLVDIYKTWYTMAPDSIFLFTDADDETANRLFDGHLINTGCKPGHGRRSLSCKMAAELNFFTKHNARWSCHVDDDNFVNIERLVETLEQLDHRKDYYIGRTSIGSFSINTPQKISFRFATGGAGLCLSQSTVKKLRPILENDNFQKLSDRFQIPDDITLGYILERSVGVELTENQNFHSHLEKLIYLKPSQLRKQITLSGLVNSVQHSVNLYSDPWDTIKMRAIHCHLYPRMCRRINRTSRFEELHYINRN